MLMLGMLLALWFLPQSVPVLPAVAPVTLSGAWTSVGLPATPLGIAEHDGTLWVCGDYAMIAASEDGGRHWTVRNLDRKGDMLFSLVFPAPKTIAAFGAGGARLVSSDGGVSWRTRKTSPDDGWSQVQFADATHGVANGSSGIATTDDGGLHWHVGGRKEQDPRLVAQAAMLANGAAAALVAHAKGQPPAVQASPADGNKWQRTTWTADWNWLGLRSDGREFFLYGSHRGSDGKKTPIEADSSDGVTWSPATLAPAMVTGGCTNQGCRVKDGWLDLRRPTPTAWQVPADDADMLDLGWAAEGETFCRVGAHLRCRSGQTAWTPSEDTDSDSMAAMTGPVPIYQPEPYFDNKDRAQRRQGGVFVAMVIGSDGSVDEISVVSALTTPMARQAVKTVRTWRFQPAYRQGQATSTVAEVAVTFRMF